jgi:hypothetical protein
LHTIIAPQLPEPGHSIASGTLAWTARRYIELERRQLAAEERLQQDRRVREDNIVALLARQEALIEPVIDLVYRRTGVKPRVAVADRDARWAMGVPVFIDQKPYAVVSPAAGRIAPLRALLRGLVLIVASEKERRSVSRAAAPGQEVLIVRPS